VWLGVLGGTFDPPHHGHLVLAELARDQLGLERVLWVPAADPPHKQGRAITRAEHRVAMLEIALRSNPHFVLCRADLERPGPHYTVDLMDILAGEYPGAAFYFLMGGDSLRDLPTWQDPARLIKQCLLAVMPRPGFTFDMSKLEATLPGLSSRVTFIDRPLVDISGSQIVRRVRVGRTIRYLVPPGVEDYIETHGLYRSCDEGQA
jgi:nicotinate-nucleotide adenylyltransferase